MQLADHDGIARLGRACREHDVLLICDEIATGFGRTGTLFASEQCAVRPDLLCLGKGLTAGYLPMSVTVASEAVFDAFLGEDLGTRTLYHGHSFGGNALAAAVALRHLELIEAWDVLANVRARSEELDGLLHDRLRAKPAVKDIRLRGLMGAVELAPPARRLALGPTRLGGRGRTRRVPAFDRRQRHVDAAAHDHLARGAPDRARPRRRDRRDDHMTRQMTRHMSRDIAWDAWADGEARAIHTVGRWRAPRDPESGRRRVRVQRLPRSHAPPRGDRGRARRARP